MTCRCKILKGNARHSVRFYDADDAQDLADKGIVKILEEDVEIEQDNADNADDEQEASDEAPQDEADEDQDVCKGTTAKGDPCSNAPQEDSEYCRHHQPSENEGE